MHPLVRDAANQVREFEQACRESNGADEKCRDYIYSMFNADNSMEYGLAIITEFILLPTFVWLAPLLWLTQPVIFVILLIVPDSMPKYDIDYFEVDKDSVWGWWLTLLH